MNSPRLRAAFYLLLLALVTAPALLAGGGPPALNCPTATGREATFVLNLPEGTLLPAGEGWIVVSTPSSPCVGQAAWHPELRTLTIHGDDPLTAAADGAQAGEPLSLHLYDASGIATEVTLAPTLDPTACAACNPDLVYTHDGLYVVSDLEIRQATGADPAHGIAEASVQALFPNPTREASTLRIALPAAEHVRIVLYDMLGREVRRIHDDLLQAGISQPQVKTSGLASGTYLLRVEGESFNNTRSLLVIE